MLIRKFGCVKHLAKCLTRLSTSASTVTRLTGPIEDDTDPFLPARLPRPPPEDIIFEKCTEDLSYLAPELKPSFNLAAYADKSKTLQEFVKLGVDLHRIERTPGAAEVILRLNFDRDVRRYIQFLTDVGVKPDDLGFFFSKNPFIFKEDISDLVVRINYLEAKRFTPESISRIITVNPRWLLHNTQDIDTRLGFLQGNFNLIGSEVRQVATKMPKLVTYKLRSIEALRFSVREEMGFSADESKMILLEKPKVYTLSRKHVVARFDFVHNEMKLTHERIVAEPSILLYRLPKVRERHLFLVELKRAQYDPTKPGYVSLKALVSGTDVDFCANVAKTEVQIFNQFLRTL